MSKDKRYKLSNAKLKGIKKNLKKDDEDAYPLFCFKYLSNHSIKKAKDVKVFIGFLQRLKDLSILGWKGISCSRRHQYGMEKIPIKQIRPKLSPLPVFDGLEYLSVFRATGNNLPFLGPRLKNSNVFSVLFIETKFNDIYQH